MIPISFEDDRSEEDVYAFQVRRMRHMKGYPRDSDQEWIDIARKYTASVLALGDAISQLIEECLSCPSCAELRTALIARRPDPEPEWKHAPQSQPKESALAKFFEENDQIMVHARQKERETQEKDRRVKELLGIHDFMVVCWPQRFWAERELGYAVTAKQVEEIEDWLSVLTHAPNVVIGKAQRDRGELAVMFREGGES
jgi:hypothetical protein